MRDSAVLLGVLAAVACGDGTEAPSPGASGSSSIGGSAGGGVGGTAVAGSSGFSGSSAGLGGTGAGAGGGSAVGCAIPENGMEPPSLLSQTGCVNMVEPSKPLAGFVPYSVRSPLWSDGAEKHRFLRVPSGSKIHVVDCSSPAEAAGCADDSIGGDDGHWQMPVGTVLVKNFSLGGKIIETRLVMRRSMTRWLFYGYEWNEGATEAALLPDDEVGKDRQVGAQVWHYPGRGQCPQCHTPGAGFSLGPSTPQMSSDFPYAEGAMNQVDKLTQLGLFDAPPKPLPGYPDPAGADELEARARSYLQVNCAVCHRPSGEYGGMDMRWGKPLADMKLCELSERDPGKNGLPKYRVVPGNPTQSSMSFRVHALDELRMPEIGSNVVDPIGAKLIDDWIAAMPTTACPPQP
ncbi:MAG: hypothetical protein K0R38_1125 [Polyangiaceae bacterium]|nr:hypothetical protein [Polyangiaceae bacterium]